MVFWDKTERRELHQFVAEESLTPELRGAGGRNQGKTGQGATPRPLERRVGLRTGKEWLLHFAFRSWLLNIRRNARSTATIAPYGPIAPYRISLRSESALRVYHNFSQYSSQLCS